MISQVTLPSQQPSSGGRRVELRSIRPPRPHLSRSRRQRGHFVHGGDRGMPPVTPAAPSVLPGAAVELIDRWVGGRGREGGREGGRVMSKLGGREGVMSKLGRREGGVGTVHVKACLPHTLTDS